MINNRSEIYKVDLNENEFNDARIIALNYIHERSTVLDVGAACGDFGLLLKNKKQCKVYGMEYDIKSIEIAKSTKAYNDIHQIDLNNFHISDYKHYINYFDTIVLLDVLEHLLYPEKVLELMQNFLKEDGYFIISLPNVAFADIKASLLQNDFTYTDTGILDKTHLKFYTYKSIIDFMTILNLRITDFNVKVNNMSAYKKIPKTIKKYILKCPHSYVYQYIICAEQADSSTNLLEDNTKTMSLTWKKMNPTLKIIKRKELIQNIFPTNSFQHRIAKQIKRLLKK